jgi:hypothetical protein
MYVGFSLYLIIDVNSALGCYTMSEGNFVGVSQVHAAVIFRVKM